MFVDCSYNDLSNLNLSNLPLLQRLLCNNNMITTLDVSFDMQLTYINCRNNQIFDMQTIGCNNLRMIAGEWNP